MTEDEWSNASLMRVEASAQSEDKALCQDLHTDPDSRHAQWFLRPLRQRSDRRSFLVIHPRTTAKEMIGASSLSKARFVPVGTRSCRGARLGRQATGLPGGRVRRAGRRSRQDRFNLSLDPETARERSRWEARDIDGQVRARVAGEVCGNRRVNFTTRRFRRRARRLRLLLDENHRRRAEVCG